MSSPQEIERKFLPRAMPWDANLSWPALGQPTYGIRQCYIVNTPEASVRIRLEDYTGPTGGIRAVLCVKKATDSMLVRDEDQFEMNFEDALDFIHVRREEHVIDKDRYCVDGYDIDMFKGPLTGLIIIEREFPSVDEANAFVVPLWIGREVTNDPAYINANLIGKRYEDGELIEYNSLS